jgi:hypothetical protein
MVLGRGTFDVARENMIPSDEFCSLLTFLPPASLVDVRPAAKRTMYVLAKIYHI